MINALPTRRDEAWKYSDLRTALKGVDAPMAGEGLLIERLAEAAGAMKTRAIGDGGSATSVDYVGNDGFAPSAEAVRVGAGAKYDRVIVQGGTGVALSSCRVLLGPSASFRQFVIAEGGNLARIETHVSVEGEGAEVELNGVYLCGLGRHADLTSVVTHKASSSRTQQLIKGVVRKGGRGVFQGKIVVERAAQKTDARQHHKGILLEEGAEIFAKPELMIYADDVACAHGNTAGGLDESALFYMRSRGVPGAEARALLTEAFLMEAVPGWLPPDVHEEVSGRIAAWLRGAP